MLSPEEKERIRQEEIFRHAVRQELRASSPPAAAHRFWAIANKPVVIWFLATIVVGVVSWTFDRVQLTRELARKEAQIDLEIASRLINARIFYVPDHYLVSHLDSGADQATLESLVPDMHGAFGRFQMALDSDTPYGAFPEYRQQSLAALIWELVVLRDDEPTGELRSALDAALDLKLKRIFWDNRNNFESAVDRIREEFEAVELNVSALELERWSLGHEIDPFAYDPDLGQPDLR